MYFRIFIITAILLSSLSGTSQAGRLYKWVDDDGNVHYSDKLPPTETHRARQQLDEHGITVDRVDAAKTAEQLQQEAEQERLRQEQQRILEKQQAQDRVLLRTFRSEDDILMTRNGQIQAVDTSIRVTESNIRRLKSTLDDMQQLAAQRELSGKPVSPKMRQDIETKRIALTEAYQSIIAREHDKNRIRQSFARDLQRFRELKKLRTTNNPAFDADNSFAQALQNVYDCGQDTACDRPWKLARKYLRQHSTTPIKIDAENIIISGEAINEGDISISMSRIRDPKQGNTLIFMDLQCKSDPQRNASCQGTPEVKRIKAEFQAALQP
ncbi:MAG: DUF4124 domain-containing protein [Candidatus Thiodiazotropha sp.]